MATLETARTALYNKIWNTGISRDVTVKTLTSSSVDDYGDVFEKTYSDSTSRAVPYETFSHQRSFEPWGTLQDGMTDMALPYTTSINKDSLIVDEGTTYEVVENQPYPFGDGTLAVIVRLREQL